MKIVLDTSVYIDYLRSKKGIYLRISQLGRSSTLYTPTLVIHELWTGESMNRPEVVKEVKRAILPTKIVGLNRQLAEDSGKLMQKYPLLQSGDSIVAATAMYLEAELATSNVKHFKNIKGLKMFKPKSS